MNEAELDALYRAWYVPLWRFARTLVRSDADAQDLVHDVFAAVLARDVELTPAYLFRAVRNAALDRARHAIVVDRTDAAFDDTPLAMSEPFPSPDVATEVGDTTARLVAAIHALPERQRSAILLRWRYGLTATDVGRVMDISDTAARKLLAAAEAKLRPLL